MKNIPAADFARQYKTIKKEIDDAIKKVLESGRYILGREVENFERSLAKFLKIKHVVGVASGTDALMIAIKSLGLQKDDEIIIPANSYPTAFGVFHSGAKIVLADVEKETLNVSVETLNKVLTKKTKAIVVVHLYGNPADILKIKKFAKKNKLFLIEDCAQAIGAEFDGKKVGTFGDISCFSFYPTKNLGAVGDAGAIVCNNSKFFNRVRLLRNYGEENRYNSILIGHNSRLDELQASILSVKLKYLNSWNKKRRALAKRYSKLLKGLPVEIIKETQMSKSVYHLYVVKTKRRDELSAFLKSRNIAVLVHYPIIISQIKSFEELSKGNFPVSQEASKEILSLPIFAEMEEKEVDYVVSSMKEFFNLKKK